MGNLAGVTAILSVLVRPALVVPHVQAPDIRHLDWSALHASGVRYLVFDKDNCLTIPHSDHLEPALVEPWSECQRVFGRENILIVSNSSGSTDDPSGLGAESLSRALGVPVLCHSQKKPGATCVRDAMEYFVRLSIDPEGTLREGQRMPPGSPSSSAEGETWLARRKSRKLLRDSIPQDSSGNGSILLVGDRTMTDVVLAHRMNDELVRRRKKAGIDVEIEWSDYEARTTGAPANPSIVQPGEPLTTLGAAMSLSPGVSAPRGGQLVPPPQCISVLTTGLWANEGRLNMWMRSMENRITLFLIQRGFQPGQRGLFSPRKGKLGQVPWQSIAVLENPQISTPADVEAANAEATSLAAGPGDETDGLQTARQPTLGGLVLMAMLRPLPPRLAGAIRAVIESRPVSWVAFHMKEGWNIIVKGLQLGAREAGLLEPTGRRKSRHLYQAEAEEDPLLPPSSRKRPPTLRSVLSSPPVGSPILDQIRWPRTQAASTAFRTMETFSASKFLQRFDRTSSVSTSPSGAAGGSATSKGTTRGQAHLGRSFSTSTRLRSKIPPPSSSRGPATTQRGKVPMRNWIAALSALVLVPACYYGGVYLHDLQDLRKAERELKEKNERQLRLVEAERVASIPPVEAEKMLGYDEKANRARQEERVERRRALELTLYHLNHEREEILDKLERVQTRLAESRSDNAPST